MASIKDAVESMAANIEDKTGKSVAAWVALARDGGFEKHGQILKWLKSEHAISHGYANYIALQTIKPDDGGSGSNEADKLFWGTKTALRPVYDAVVAVVTKFGPDIELAPKKAYVSVRRRKQFALLQPSTKDRFCASS